MGNLREASIDDLRDEKEKLDNDWVEACREVEDMELELESAEERMDTIEQRLYEIEEEIERRAGDLNE